MKPISKIVVVMFLALVPVLVSGQQKDKSTETVKYSTSIDCENCVNKIMTNLPHEKGIKDVRCDLKTKEVTVTYSKGKNNSDGIKKAIEKLGYTARVVNPAEPEKNK